MFAFIKGILVEATALSVVVDVQGMGYKIFIPANALAKLPQIGEIACLHTSFVVREFAHSLYGFLSSSERDLFEALLNVNGIGPKLALSLIGHMPIRDLQNAIVNHDLKVITRVPGIGKKTAERLIIEMKDKLSQFFTNHPEDFAIHISSDPRTQIIRDAMSALINLGYNQVTAQKAIKKTIEDSSEEIDLPSLITTALKNI